MAEQLQGDFVTFQSIGDVGDEIPKERGFDIQVAYDHGNATAPQPNGDSRGRHEFGISGVDQTEVFVIRMGDTSVNDGGIFESG